MAKRLDRLAEVIGSAIGSYRKAMRGSRFGRRHAFFTSLAEEARWRTTTGHEEIAQRRAMQNSWVFSAISLIARAVSAAKFQVVEYRGVDEEPIQVPNHPLEEILRRPNPYMGGSFMWQYTTWWLQLDGNAYWWLGVNPVGGLAEIWPLPANNMEIVPGDGQDKLIEAYEYTVQGTAYVIPAEYVLHFMLPNPYDVFRGMSPLVAAILPTDSDMAMSRWNARFFGRDNVMPSAIINLSSGDPEQPIDPADAEGLKEDLRSSYTAFGRRTAVTSAFKMEVELLGWNPRDMDFFQGRQFSKEEIHEIYGIPGGFYDKNATYANSENASRVFNDKTLWPLLVLVAEQITTGIINPYYADNLVASFEDVRSEAREMQLQEIGAAGPYMTIDEIRRKFYSLPALPDGRGQMTTIETQASGFGGEEGPFGEEPESMEGREPAGGNGSRPSESSQLADQDLKRWRRRSLNHIRKGKPIPLDFVSDTIPERVFSRLQGRIGRIREAQDGGASRQDVVRQVKAAFRDVIGTRRVPRKGRVSVVVELASWERRIIKSIEIGGRPDLRRPPSLPLDMAAWVRREVTYGPQTVDAIRSVFEEVADFFLPFSVKAPLGKKRRRPWERWEAHLRRSVTRALERRAKEVAKVVRERGEGILGDEDFWSGYRRSLFQAVLESVSGIARLGIRHGQDRLGARASGVVDWNLVNRDAANWARQYTYDLVSGITGTVREELQGGVSGWVESGATLPDLVRIATDIVKNPVRGKLIAETEATRAYAEGNDKAWTAAGIKPAMYKPPAHPGCRCYLQPHRMPDGTVVMVWYTVRDERVCIQPVKVPWSAMPIEGCKALHRVVVSQGKYLGTKIRSKR